MIEYIISLLLAIAFISVILGIPQDIANYLRRDKRKDDDYSGLYKSDGTKKV